MSGGRSKSAKPAQAAEAASPRAADVRGTASPVEVRSLAVEAVRLRWEIAAEAVRAACPDFAIDAKSERVMLEWTVPMASGREASGVLSDGANARAELVDPVSGSRLAIAVVTPSRDDLAGPVKWMVDGDLHHLEIDGLLSATVRASKGVVGAGTAVEVLYARTELLARMGLPGGRYEVLRIGSDEKSRP